MDAVELSNDHPMLLVCRLRACLTDEDDVNIDSYIELWEELCRFIQRWGGFLKFVTDDIAEKLGGIRELREEKGEKTTTFKTMTTWEAEEKRMRSYKPKSGTVNVLVLHRAFDFIIGLIDGVFKEEKPDAKVSSIAREAYDRSMARYHPWLIRKVVSTALLALPYRKEFVTIMRGPMPPEEDHNFRGEFTRLAEDVKGRIAVVLKAYEMTEFTKHSK